MVLPKVMALELFKSYMFMLGLFERELAPNLRVAKRMVEELQARSMGCFRRRG